MSRFIWMSLLITFGIGCVEENRVERSNEGLICIGESPSFYNPEVSVDPEATTRVQVLFDSCAASCATNVETSCSVTFDAQNSTIRISSRASWETPNTSCNNSCYEIVANCDGPTLAEGTYTILHGQDSRQLTVPSTYSCADLL